MLNIFSDMQRIWDLHKDHSKINLIVGGSVNTLMNELFRDNKQPIFEKTDNKNVCYSLRDNFLTFWFRFIYKYSFMLEIKAYKKLRELTMRDYETFSGFMLERYFRELLIEKEIYTRIGGWRDRKGANEIDIVAADDIEHKIDFIEVKRNTEKYRSGLLEEKTQAFLQVNKELSSWSRSFQCLLLEDL